MGESTPVGPASPPNKELRLRLLVVDDEPALREIASALLAEAGYEVLTARDGSDALRLLVEPLPDVVITDLRMPGMSGFELMAVVRQRFPQLPVIAVSGEFAGDEFPPGIMADAYLSKGSFNTADLCAKITQLIAASPLRPQRATEH